MANGSFASLKANTTTYKEKNYALFVRTVDFANDFKKDLVYIDKITYDFLEKSKLYGNELMLSNIGASIGKVFKIPMFDMPMSLAPNSIILRFFDGIFTDFFEYMFKSFVGQDYLQMLSGGSAMPKFNKTDLRAMIVPVAPSNEQIKIVEKINSIFTLIEKIDNSHTDISGLVQSAKSKILDLAIQGKLVPQNKDDEPASVLLERIKDEKEDLIKQGKIKRDKKESVIFKGEDNSYYEKIGDNIVCIDDEIPFEIPAEWRWERLGNISTIARGRSPRPINEYLTNQDDGINWIKIGDTEQGGKYIYSTKEKIIPEGLSKTRHVKSGDFLLTNSMSYGRPYILKTDGCIHDGWLVIADIENIFYQDFLYYALSSNEMYRTFTNLAAGSTVKNLKSDSVKSILFPIPPYDEQLRISNYVEKIYQMIDIIEKSLS